MSLHPISLLTASLCPAAPSGRNRLPDVSGVPPGPRSCLGLWDCLLKLHDHHLTSWGLVKEATGDSLAPQGKGCQPFFPRSAVIANATSKQRFSPGGDCHQSMGDEETWLQLNSTTSNQLQLLPTGSNKPTSLKPPVREERQCYGNSI